MRIGGGCLQGTSLAAKNHKKAQKAQRPQRKKLTANQTPSVLFVPFCGFFLWLYSDQHAAAGGKDVRLLRV
jgi:hypothetical protein